MLPPKKYSPDPEALVVLHRHLWSKRAVMAIGFILAALFFTARIGPLDGSHAAASVAFLIIFLAGGRRAIAQRIADVEAFELWVDDGMIRWRRGEQDRGEIDRADIASIIDKRSGGIEVKQKSAPIVLRIPRQLTHYDELRSDLLKRPAERTF